MRYIVLGVLGILVVHVCDPAAIRRLPLVKPLAWGLGLCLLSFATIMACLSPSKIPLPLWSTIAGWGLLLASFALLAYALFINLPFRRTYVATGVGDQLVTSGLYALVRHPGVMWTVLLIVALVLVSRSWLVLVAAPIFILLDIGTVALQDRYFFPRMFAGYSDYRRETPMLIPNRRSLRAFARSFTPVKANGLKPERRLT